MRKEVWFNPPRDPIRTDKTIIKAIKMSSFKVYDKSIKGAIFCHVINAKPFIQFNPSITPGNQKWNGAAPIFSNKAELIRIGIKVLWIIEGVTVLKVRALIVTASKSVAEAKACVKKYFNEASVEKRFFVLVINGIKDSKLISNPIHAPNQEFADVEIKVPLISVIKNKNLVGLLSIREKRGRTSIYGVWTH